MSAGLEGGGVLEAFTVAINNGDGNCAGRNAVNLFTQTSRWAAGLHGRLRRRAEAQISPPALGTETQRFSRIGAETGV